MVDERERLARESAREEARVGFYFLVQLASLLERQVGADDEPLSSRRREDEHQLVLVLSALSRFEVDALKLAVLHCLVLHRVERPVT